MFGVKFQKVKLYTWFRQQRNKGYLVTGLLLSENPRCTISSCLKFYEGHFLCGISRPFHQKMTSMLLLSGFRVSYVNSITYVTSKPQILPTLLLYAYTRDRTIKKHSAESREGGFMCPGVCCRDSPYGDGTFVSSFPHLLQLLLYY